MTARGEESAQAYVWWSLVNLFLAVVAICVTLWAYMQDRELRTSLTQLTAAKTCPPKVIVAATPMIVEDTPVKVPPQNVAKSGYIGDAGTSILPAMHLDLEVIRGDDPDGTATKVRLGSPQVLPPRTIHVVNLWATWCGPCVEELPDFRAMFARRARDWGDRVHFVPIMVKDAAAPEVAYRDKDMLAAPAKLADRSYGDQLVAALTADAQRTLFKGNLPVTLVLDCNRRVRWAQFEQLRGGSFKQLEGYIDRFLAEIDDDSPGAWCTQEWPGNGRCEGEENTAKHHSLADCGPLKKSTGDPGEAASAEPENPANTCLEGSEVLANGLCKPKLVGVTKTTVRKPPVLVTCGNGKCDDGEDNLNCCVDCPCEAPMVCKQMGDDPKRCLLPGLLKK